jgi:hypothetical protein
MWKFNPFRPGSIASPGMFAGRGDELRSADCESERQAPRPYLGAC